MQRRIYFSLLCKILSLSLYLSLSLIRIQFLFSATLLLLSLVFLHMELFQELLFTVALSLLVSFVLAKLFSIASTCDVAGDESVSVSVTDVIEKEVMHDRKSVVCNLESERSKVRFVEEAVESNINELEEEEFRVETIGSPEINDDGQVEVEVVGIEEDSTEESVCEEVKEGGFDLGELKEEKVSVSGGEFKKNSVDESSKFREIEIDSKNLREIEIELAKDEASVAKNVEVGVMESEDGKGNDSDGVNNNAEEEEGWFDDWEGIERTELERHFGAAVVFVGSMNNADRFRKLENDVKMQLYGLHKVAIEGLCREPPPMALKVSARAKW